MTTAADLWHHYGRARAEHDSAVPDTFRWTWSQRDGPGPEILGDLTGKRVADLGAGAARHAAHLVAHHQPAQVHAVDASPAQHDMATRLYAHLAPRLRFVPTGAVPHLHTTPDTYDVLYSVFGALDFTDPRELLPAAAAALAPGGRLVFSTLAHHLNGAPAQPDATPADISARTPSGETTTMRRWVLQEHVWVKLLDEAGFADINVTVHPSAGNEPRAADTLLVTATVAPEGAGITERERKALHALWPAPHPSWGWGESEQEHREGVEAAYREASQEVREILRRPLSIMAGHLEEKRIDPSRCTCYPRPCWYREWLLERCPPLRRGRRDTTS